MARQVKLFQVSDFGGGLNFRDDAFTLSGNELADCMNVRIMPKGGVQRRKTVKHLNTNALTTAPRNVWQFLGNGVTHIIVQDGNDAAYSTGDGTFTAINPDALVTAGLMRAASMARLSSASSERCYIQRNAEQVPWKWSGSAATVLAAAEGAYNANLAAPAGGRMPVAKYIVAHAGFMFHANTLEGGTAFPSRIRFSHPGEPEDYRSNDFIDVGGDDGDVITGLASMAGILYIFKNRSVWALTGTDTTTFALSRLADTIGAVSQEAIAHSDSGIYFFDGLRGVFAIGAPKLSTSIPQVDWLWPKLQPKLKAGTIPAAHVGKVTCGWLDNRLWVSVPYGSSATSNTRIFVYDPQCGKEGAWYAYQFANSSSSLSRACGPFLEWRPNSTTVKLLACDLSTNLLQLEFDDGVADILAPSSGTAAYRSNFTTAWFAAGMPGVKKRFRRPTFVVDADADAQIGVTSYRNYTSLVAAGTQAINVTAQTSGTGTWGTGTWGTGTWGAAPAGEQSVIRGSAFGNAYAVQLKFTGPQDKRWGLNAIDVRYVPQRIR